MRTKAQMFAAMKSPDKDLAAYTNGHNAASCGHAPWILLGAASYAPQAAVDALTTRIWQHARAAATVGWHRRMAWHARTWPVGHAVGGQ